MRTRRSSQTARNTGKNVKQDGAFEMDVCIEAGSSEDSYNRQDCFESKTTKGYRKKADIGRRDPQEAKNICDNGEQYRCSKAEKILQLAIQSLHGADDSEDLVERKQLCERIQAFIERSAGSKSSGVLYLCGPPGTGKSTCVEKVLDTFEQNYKSVTVLRLNAVGLSESATIFQRLGEGIGMSKAKVNDFPKQVKANGITELMSTIVEHQQRKRNKCIVYLDEVDQLPTILHRRGATLKSSSRVSQAKEDVLLSLFNLCLNPKSKLILVAIANAATLAFDVFPRLEKNADNFESLLFEPYTFEQLKNIVTHRMTSCIRRFNEQSEVQNNDVTRMTGEKTSLKKMECVTDKEILEIIDERALEYCIRKVAAFHGDCRQVMDACRRGLNGRLVRIREGIINETNNSYEETNDMTCDEDLLECNHDRNTHCTNEVVRTPVKQKKRSTSPLDMSTPYSAIRNMTISSNEDKENTPFQVKRGLICRVTRSSSDEDSNMSTADVCTVSTSQSTKESVHAENKNKQKHKNVPLNMIDMNSVLNTQYRDDKAKNRFIVQGLPQHCKVILCAACQLCSKENYNMKVEINDLQKQYMELCRSHKIPVQGGKTSLIDGLTGLESSGLINVVNNRRTTTPLKKHPGSRARNRQANENSHITFNIDKTELIDLLNYTSKLFSTIIES